MGMGAFVTVWLARLEGFRGMTGLAGEAGRLIKAGATGGSGVLEGRSIGTKSLIEGMVGAG